MLPFLLARRYLFSKDLPGAVNIITSISVVGIALGAAALIFVLSIFNGFHALVRDMFADFDADLQINPKKGKYFSPTPELLQKIQSTQGVEFIVPIIEGKAILKNKDKQRIIKLRGVGNGFEKVSEIKKLIQVGEFLLKKEPPTIVMGTGVAYFVNAGPDLWETPMELFTVSEKKDLATAGEEAIRQIQVYPTGVFSMQKEYDEQIVLIHIEHAAALFETGEKISAYELRVTDKKYVQRIKNELALKLGPQFDILTWYEQHQTLYELMRNEKRIGFLVITLMLILTASNIVSSLTVIVMEKRKDIAILRSMGATRSYIAYIFLWLGLYIGIYGGGSGLVLGVILAVLQDQYGFIRLNGGDAFIIDYFPVELHWQDIGIVMITVATLCGLSSLYPCFRASGQEIARSLAK
jgi:lipoprotein-releasing system permease protein